MPTVCGNMMIARHLPARGAAAPKARIAESVVQASHRKDIIWLEETVRTKNVGIILGSSDQNPKSNKQEIDEWLLERTDLFEPIKDSPWPYGTFRVKPSVPAKVKTP